MTYKLHLKKLIAALGQPQYERVYGEAMRSLAAEEGHKSGYPSAGKGGMFVRGKDIAVAARRARVLDFIAENPKSGYMDLMVGIGIYRHEACGDLRHLRSAQKINKVGNKNQSQYEVAT